MHLAPLDARPVIAALAGPNGAGKTIFYHAHLRQTGLPFINADVLARGLNLDPYAAARMADVLRREFVARRASFVFETVFSDPVEDKLSFLRETAGSGYTVVLCYIGISGPDVSEVRVAMRVSQGGHDVATEKLRSRVPRRWGLGNGVGSRFRATIHHMESGSSENDFRPFVIVPIPPAPDKHPIHRTTNR